MRNRSRPRPGPSLIDLIAPFGGQQEIIKDLKDKVFEGKVVKTLQPALDGRGVAVVEW